MGVTMSRFSKGTRLLKKLVKEERISQEEGTTIANAIVEILEEKLVIARENHLILMQLKEASERSMLNAAIKEEGAWVQ